MPETINSESAIPRIPSKARRFASDFTDLIIMPVFLGLMAGLLLAETYAIAPISEFTRSMILSILNMVWFIFRDWIYSPGRHYLARKILNALFPIGCAVMLIWRVIKQMGVGDISFIAVGIAGLISVMILLFDRRGPGAELKLVRAADGRRVNPVQVVIRNIPIIVPGMMATGYFCEFIRVYIPKVWVRRILHGVILALSLLFFPRTLASKNFLMVTGNILAMTVPLFFLIKDKKGPFEGQRLMDQFAHTQVVAAA